MKTLMKCLSLVLALLMVVAIFVSCGKPAETTGAGTNASTTEEGETGRKSVKDTVPADLSFSGSNDNEVTFFVRSNGTFFLTEICSDEITNDIYTDAIHYRNIDVETQLGVKIKQIAQAGSETDGTWRTWNETLSTAVLTKTGDYDGALLHQNCATGLALQNIYMNLLTVDTKSGKGVQKVFDFLNTFFCAWRKKSQ